MEYNIVINQAVLRRWVRKINLKDAAIVGFIRNLSPNDPLIRHYMLNGYFRLDAGWILRQLPLLDISEDWIRRSLTKLQDEGLIDCIKRSGRKKRLTTYGRVSLQYMEEEQRVEEALEADTRYAEKTPGIGENPRTGRKLPVRGKDPGETPIDHKKDQCKAVGAAPSWGAAPDSPEEKRVATEAEFEASLEGLSPEHAHLVRKRRQVEKQQGYLPGIPRATGESDGDRIDDR